MNQSSSIFPPNNFESVFKTLKLDMTPTELSGLMEDYKFSKDQISAVDQVFEYLREKKIRNTIDMYLRTSRLPLKAPKTFDNFDFSVVHGKYIERLQALSALNALKAHKNIAFIGPPGTGKTHLAQAYGYECCQKGFKTYFIKMSELRDKFTTARRNGKEASCLNGLVRPACLIIDEVGHCEFDKENTRLFFDMIDRRYNRQGCNNIIFTSNKNPALWKQNFNDDDDLLCALDRIFDDATVFTIRGKSYRGKSLENITLQTTIVSGSTESEKTNS